MRYKIAIVEDEKQSMDLLVKYFKQFEKENQITFDFYTFEDGDEITHEYKAMYDIIFLDIEMKRLDGMSAAEQIRKLDPNVIIVFVTNMRQYAIKGYKVDALSFLVKPVSYFAFSQELQKLIVKADKNKQKQYLLLPTDKGFKRISFGEVKYIESFKHDLFVHAIEESYQIRETLKKMEERLKGSSFFRCHNSYLVNLDYVEAVEKENIIIDGKKISISRNRKKDFMRALAFHLGESK